MRLNGNNKKMSEGNNQHSEMSVREVAEDLKTARELRKTLMRRLDLLLQAGCLLMESGADTSRVLRNMKRVAVWLGLDENYLHIVVNYEVLQVNYSDAAHSFTKFRSCLHHASTLQPSPR